MLVFMNYQRGRLQITLIILYNIMFYCLFDMLNAYTEWTTKKVLIFTNDIHSVS